MLWWNYNSALLLSTVWLPYADFVKVITMGIGGDSLMRPWLCSERSAWPARTAPIVSDSTLWEYVLVFFPLELKREQGNKPFLGAAQLSATLCL